MDEFLVVLEDILLTALFLSDFELRMKSGALDKYFLKISKQFFAFQTGGDIFRHPQDDRLRIRELQRRFPHKFMKERAVLLQFEHHARPVQLIKFLRHELAREAEFLNDLYFQILFQQNLFRDGFFDLVDILLFDPASAQQKDPQNLLLPVEDHAFHGNRVEKPGEGLIHSDIGKHVFKGSCLCHRIILTSSVLPREGRRGVRSPAFSG